MRVRNRYVRRLVRSEDGFTLIECLVAAVIVGVGLMSTFTLVDASSKTQAGGRAREGANNIARTFLENVRTSAYSAVNDSYLTSTLQSTPGWVSTSGMSAVVRQRKIDYTVAVSVCSIDDPKDNLGAADAAYCDGGHAASASNPDTQPDDLKRVTVTVTWTGSRATSTPVKQTAILASNGAKVGLPLQSFTPNNPTNIGASPAAPIITNSSTFSPCSAGKACFTAQATGATSITFAVDGTDQATPTPAYRDATCPASGPCSLWHFDWNITGLSDGVYRLSARSIDASGLEGTPKVILATLARGGATRETAPCGVGSTATTGAGCLPVEGG